MNVINMTATLLALSFIALVAGIPPDTGISLGYLATCPGVLKNATITPKMAELLHVVIHQWTPMGSLRRGLPITTAAKVVVQDKTIDLKHKKTMLYFVGYIDSSMFPHTQKIANFYSKKGYNVFVAETFSFLHFIYPKSARLARPIGKLFGKFLAELYENGLQPADLEIVGISLGTHIAGYASKQFYDITGKKPSRITALDPAGPCFRALPPEHRLDASDAERVDVIHTNIDGFGIAERLGHVDFYVNGGEYQPAEILYMPCLVLCSHVKSILYFWVALENPKKFIGIECDSIQDARIGNCFNNTVSNYMGSETDFTRPGIFYLIADYKFPYYKGSEGLKAGYDVFTATLTSINAGNLVMKK